MMENASLILEALWQTIYMVFFSTFFSIVIGAPLAILLVLTAEGNLSPKPILNKILNGIINSLRSFPFIILMILIFPLSRFIVGTTIGSTAAIVPLSIGASPFVARIIEGALLEVDRGIIQASKSLGATNFMIIRKVLIPEAMPSLINGIVIVIISLVGFSAMAGAIGGGGLGDVAIRFGYMRFQTDVMIYSVVATILLVQIIQSIGNLLVRNLRKKRG
ncbi:MAG: methionine ABC transporter permease [Fusobacteriaceae bacterium]